MKQDQLANKKAKAAIVECARTGATQLRLTGLGLTALPPEIWSLTALRGLDLSENSLTTLPSGIGTLTALTDFDVSKNELTTLPPEIGALRALTDLDLSRNRLASLPPEIGALTALTHLDLSLNLLVSLPPEIGALTALKRLLVSQNELVALPSEIGALTSLEKLYAYMNSITRLPPEISNLTALNGLYIHCNPLIELPPEIGALTELRDLYVQEARLVNLPRQLGELTKLTTLYLDRNDLKALPYQISQLRELRRLDVDQNSLRELPSWIGGFTEMIRLGLSENQLVSLPSEIGALTALTHLDLSENQLVSLPPEIGGLSALAQLDLTENQLTALPPEIGSLTALITLYLSGNQLTSLPPELGLITELDGLSIEDNPLPSSYADALEQGFDSFRALLASLAERTERLFEAKLLVTGEGKVGKSWALAALRGDDPEVEVGDDNTTWGIDRGTLTLPHPQASGEEIVLNTWDFGGQRIYRVTHQFFFSEQAIYLLVWNPRAGAEQCRVHEWLRTIALRTGSSSTRSAELDGKKKPRAKVIMVATHAKDKGGSYVPDYGRSRLDPDLQDMIVDEIEIDSRQGFNVDELKRMIARHAAELPEMGQALNTKWAAAREATLALRQDNPRIGFERFSAICNANGVIDQDQKIALAWTYLHRLGRAIWYGESSPDEEEAGDTALADTIILDAVWLSRAFVQILDDEETAAAGGMLDHRRLRKIWTDHGRPEWHRYDPAEYDVLKQVMRRFDVALPTRESDGRRSLVPQLVPHERPEAIPWNDAASASGARTIRMRCELGFEAIGLMPRIIAATEPWHVYIDQVGLFWDKGVFLRDSASFENEALVRLTGIERPRIDIVVSGDRPDFLMHELYRTLETVLGFWKGMTRRYSVGCPTLGSNGQPCAGLFQYDSVVRRMKERSNKAFNCQSCDADWPAERLINGFEALMVDEKYMVQHLYHRDQLLAPRVFLLEPADKNLLRVTSWAPFVGQSFKLTLLSELSGREIASKTFTLTRDWVKWVKPATRIASLMLTGAALPFGGDAATALKEESSILDKLGALPELAGDASAIREHRNGKDMRPRPEELANFAKFLAAIKLDPRVHGMDIARVPDGRWLWMSAEEVEAYRPQTAA